MNTVNLAHAISLIQDAWTPHSIGSVNDVELKLARLEGDFVWHSHPDTDELFLVLEGTLTMGLRDGDRHLSAGELLVVPRGTEHQPRSPGGCAVLLVEARGTLNTGDAPEGPLTVRQVPTLDGQ